MTFEVETAGRRHIIEVRRGPAGFAVTIDGRTAAADVIRTGRIWSLLIGPAPDSALRASSGKEAGPYHSNVGADVSQVGATHASPMRSFEITFVDEPDGGSTVYVNGQPVPVSLSAGAAGPPVVASGLSRKLQPFGRKTDSGSAAGPQRVVAPMPGKIVNVLVKAGDEVAARQGLVVVEAMKMENELRSPKAGTVAEVRVTEGMSVEAGTVLVIVS